MAASGRVAKSVLFRTRFRDRPLIVWHNNSFIFTIGQEQSGKNINATSAPGPIGEVRQLSLNDNKIPQSKC
jgi:hypothetical protein